VSPGVVALAVGTILAVAALAFVLYPLFFAIPVIPRRAEARPDATDDSAILALREIEFDRATGKLSESDYTELKKTYSERALSELRKQSGRAAAAADEASAGAALDPIDVRARQYRLSHRTCPTCGVRPEPDATYCSTCGSFLDRVCPRCSSEITEAGATFCSRCGATLSMSATAREPRAAAEQS
jgi:hypothetical protein